MRALWLVIAIGLLIGAITYPSKGLYLIMGAMVFLALFDLDFRIKVVKDDKDQHRSAS